MVKVIFEVETDKVGSIQQVVEHSITVVLKSMETCGTAMALNGDFEPGWDCDVNQTDRVDIRVDEQEVMHRNDPVLEVSDDDEPAFKKTKIQDNEGMPPDQHMKIKVNYGDKTFTLDVKPSDTIGNLKAKIHDKEGIRVDAMTLSTTQHGFLEDDQTIGSYNLRNDHLIDMSGEPSTTSSLSGSG